ncbi:hypothetical protein DVH24_027001 [Malus domestica]|uniref:Uncharacterized protein n=1 Tax=Malus domestica TaxID=3750 RepID=A0A498IQ65_MALDO|nr:hypothetical protein DVH24_027001 [Malus domestica]
MNEGTPIQNHLDDFNKDIMDLKSMDNKIDDEDHFVDTLLYGRDCICMDDAKTALNSRELKNKVSGNLNDNHSEALVAKVELRNIVQVNQYMQLFFARKGIKNLKDVQLCYDVLDFSIGDIEEFQFLHLNHFVLIKTLIVCEFGGDDEGISSLCWLCYNLSREFFRRLRTGCRLKPNQYKSLCYLELVISEILRALCKICKRVSP